jgi:PIN domain nuclease of toxin-antitoxin system
VILLDTHIWVWWVHQASELPAAEREFIESHAADGLAVSAISCWEVTLLSRRKRLDLSRPIAEWLDLALAASGVEAIPLTPEIARDSVWLPEPFHRDPADRMIVATARAFDLVLVTRDQKILSYPHVRLGP